jgi:hypothetical protein
LWVATAGAQSSRVPEVPTQFKLDIETAARLRPQLLDSSVPSVGRYAAVKPVFTRLVAQAQSDLSTKPDWQVRIVENAGLNAYASPDGTVYVESGLASLAGPRAGLWAAILSHEIAHIMRRDWARRYLYQKQLAGGSSAAIVLGDPGRSGSWTDAGKASADLAKFCRDMEIEADGQALKLMARAGYHPDFVPSLHHLLHARGDSPKNSSLYAMHPCWEERDRELSKAYAEASIEFEHRWHEWYASPGGNPPVVVFADSPTVKKTGSKEWQISIPMRCQNLVGAVEVVVRSDPSHKETVNPGSLLQSDGHSREVRQVTGCTSPTTTVIFSAADLVANQRPDTKWSDVYVVDAWGSVLARTDLPKLPR